MNSISSLFLSNVTKTDHTKPYPVVDPTSPANSQAGRTILITGGGTGIGLAIACAFVEASASTIIIVGRRIEKLKQATEELEALEKEVKTGTKILAQSCDVTDPNSVDVLWDGLKDSGVVVDVLISNAAKFSDTVGPLMEVGADYVWSLYETNVKGPLFLVQRFYKQDGDRPKAYINITSQAGHYIQSDTIQGRLPYALTKNAGTLIAQALATEIPPDKMQMLSFHPGLIWSQGWEPTGVTRDMLPFADVALPGRFAVWATTPDARFLHGRFVWSSWDINELKTGELRKRIDDDPYFLRVNIDGLRLGNLA